MKMKYADIAVVLLFAAALLVLLFFKQCTMDVYMLILGVVIIMAAGVVRLVQNKKLQELNSAEK